MRFEMTARRDDSARGPLTVLHQDEDLVAVTKPTGLLMHRSAESRDREFLLQILAHQIDRFVYPVHRLDRAASGVVVFGLSSSAAAELHRALTDASARKEYLVLTRWHAEAEDAPLRWSSTRPLRGDRGQECEARTDFEVLELLPQCALVRARIFSGRRHQIRRHLNHCARHVLGDTTHPPSPHRNGSPPRIPASQRAAVGGESVARMRCLTGDTSLRGGLDVVPRADVLEPAATP